MRCCICASACKAFTTNLRKHEGLNMRKRWMKMILIAPLAILGILLFIAIGGEIVMQLWNWLLPPLFGWRQITFWQALGILALCRILFGGFGRPWFSSLQFRPSHGRALVAHDPGGAGTIPARHARTLRLWSIHQPGSGTMKLPGAGCRRTFAYFANAWAMRASSHSCIGEWPRLLTSTVSKT